MLNCTLYFDKDKGKFQSKTCKVAVKQINGSVSKTVGEITIDLADHAAGKVAFWELSLPLKNCKGCECTLDFVVHSRPLAQGSPDVPDDTLSTVEGMDMSYVDPDSVADFGGYENEYKHNNADDDDADGAAPTPSFHQKTPTAAQTTPAPDAVSPTEVPAPRRSTSAATPAPDAEKSPENKDSGSDSDSDSGDDLVDPDTVLGAAVTSPSSSSSVPQPMSNAAMSTRSALFSMADDDDDAQSQTPSRTFANNAPAAAAGDAAASGGKSRTSSSSDLSTLKTSDAGNPFHNDEHDHDHTETNKADTKADADVITSPASTASSSSSSSHRSLSKQKLPPTSPLAASGPCPRCAACEELQASTAKRLDVALARAEKAEARAVELKQARDTAEARAENLENTLAKYDGEAKTVIDSLRAAEEEKRLEMTHRAEDAEEKLARTKTTSRAFR
jgi:hypothetical protein